MNHIKTKMSREIWRLKLGAPPQISRVVKNLREVSVNPNGEEK